jgi:hypothetical protein
MRRRALLVVEAACAQHERVVVPDMLGPAARAAGEESFEMVVPAMKIKEFQFTEVTKF